MQTTGELIRLLSYVDDIAATLHRIDATIPTLTPEERPLGVARVALM
jgi:hypothetical protein